MKKPSSVAMLHARGFDKSQSIPFESAWRLGCSQCQALTINGHPTHETGCRNTPRRSGATVFTGWRTITPGPCLQCGESDRWDCDGRGTVYCMDCDTCPDCGVELDGHAPACPRQPNKEED